MELTIRLRTHFWGVCVGEDSLGNRYYRDRHFGFGARAGDKERRWVVYRDEAEASNGDGGVAWMVASHNR